MASASAEKILGRLKGLHKQLRDGEIPLYSIPVIWENVREQQSQACDLVLTNQRLFGYIYVTFPRERLFLDGLELACIKIVSFRQKNFEAIFRELLVSDGEKKVYIRATHKKIEDAYATLRAAIKEYTSIALPVSENPIAEQTVQKQEVHPMPVYGKQEIRQPLERSPQGIALLFVSGILLEVIGALIWVVTGSGQIGGPLCLAGLVAVVIAILALRQLR